MKRTGSRISKIIALVIIPFLVAVSIDFLTEITGGKIGDFLQKNFGISNKTLVFVLLGLLGLALSFQFYSSWVENDSEKTPAPTPEDKLKKLLAEFHSSLKKRYEKRYLGKLDGRFEITLEVSENWLSDKPKTHKFDAEAKISDAMDAINKAFTETGRLLIVGSPGSGKTVLLLKLAIEILKKADPEDGPFPVIFNLASWKNDFENFEDWLVDVLNSGNGLSKDFARELLREQKIILFLDGLDELARNESSEKASEIRANCMASLNLYLRMGRKAVICCRRDEFVEMFAGTSQDAPVSAKVEVLDLTEADIILALQEAGKDEKSRDAAKHIEDHMEKNPAFLNVLSTPFFFTTALEVFDQPLRTDTAIPQGEENIKSYLMEKFTDNKIINSRDLHSVEKGKTKEWLGWLARVMEKKQKVIFELADLQPTDLVRKWYFGLIVVFVFSLIFSLIFSLFGGLIYGLIYGLLYYVLIAGLIYGLLHGLFYGYLRKTIQTEDIVEFKFSKRSLYNLFVGLLLGLFFGLIFGLIDGLFTGLIVGLIVGLIYGLIFSLKGLKSVKEIAHLENSYQRLFGGVYANVILTAAIIILVGSLNLISGYFKDINFYGFLLQSRVLVKIFFILPFLFIIEVPIIWHLFLRLALWLEHSLPLRYATFLDHCAEAGILEKDGGCWRFRHQNLQDHLAKREE